MLTENNIRLNKQNKTKKIKKKEKKERKRREKEKTIGKKKISLKGSRSKIEG